MPKDTEKATQTENRTAVKASTFQQTAPEGEEALTAREAEARALNAPGADPAESNPGGEVTGTETLPADERVEAIRQADAENDAPLDEGNVVGKSVQVRMPDGSERVMASEEEAMASGGEVLGFADGEPYVASAPAYLRNQKAEG